MTKASRISMLVLLVALIAAILLGATMVQSAPTVADLCYVNGQWVNCRFLTPQPTPCELGEPGCELP